MDAIGGMSERGDAEGERVWFRCGAGTGGGDGNGNGNGGEMVVGGELVDHLLSDVAWARSQLLHACRGT